MKMPAGFSKEEDTRMDVRVHDGSGVQGDSRSAETRASALSRGQEGSLSQGDCRYVARARS